MNGGVLDESNAVKFITEDAVEHSATKIVPAGSIMVGVRVGVGKVAVNSVPMCTSQDIVSIIGVDEQLWNKEYISYAIQYKAPRLAAQAQGATITGITSKALKAVTIPVREKSSQDQIVWTLNYLKELLLLSEQRLAKLDTLVKSRFVEMFGDPASNPKRFPAKPGSELFRLGNGKTKPVSQRFNNGVPAYGGNGITWYTDEAMTSGPTIVLGRVGRHCGNARLVIEPCWVTDNAMYIKNFYDSSLDFIYLINLMSIVKFNRYADEGDLWKITQRPFMEFEFPLPPLALQHKFSAFVQRVDKLRVEAQAQKEKLQTLYDSLAQDYFAI